MSASTRTALHQQVGEFPVSDIPPARLYGNNHENTMQWLDDMTDRLESLSKSSPILTREGQRREFLIAVHYEASRAGVSPQLALAIIHVESAFRKYAVSSAGARGYMQVMPFWVNVIGEPDHNLFHLRANLRYGMTILRHYIDIENGDLFRALGRYNGSLGKAKYPNLVLSKYEKYWAWKPTTN